MNAELTDSRYFVRQLSLDEFSFHFEYNFLKNKYIILLYQNIVQTVLPPVLMKKIPSSLPREKRKKACHQQNMSPFFLYDATH